MLEVGLRCRFTSVSHVCGKISRFCPTKCSSSSSVTTFCHSFDSRVTLRRIWFHWTLVTNPRLMTTPYSRHGSWQGCFVQRNDVERERWRLDIIVGCDVTSWWRPCSSSCGRWNSIELESLTHLHVDECVLRKGTGIQKTLPVTPACGYNSGTCWIGRKGTTLVSQRPMHIFVFQMLFWSAAFQLNQSIKHTLPNTCISRHSCCLWFGARPLYFAYKTCVFISRSQLLLVENVCWIPSSVKTLISTEHQD